MTNFREMDYNISVGNFVEASFYLRIIFEESVKKISKNNSKKLIKLVEEVSKFVVIDTQKLLETINANFHNFSENEPSNFWEVVKITSLYISKNSDNINLYKYSSIHDEKENVEYALSLETKKIRTFSYSNFHKNIDKVKWKDNHRLLEFHIEFQDIFDRSKNIFNSGARNSLQETGVLNEDGSSIIIVDGGFDLLIMLIILCSEVRAYDSIRNIIRSSETFHKLRKYFSIDESKQDVKLVYEKLIWNSLDTTSISKIREEVKELSKDKKLFSISINDNEDVANSIDYKSSINQTGMSPLKFAVTLLMNKLSLSMGAEKISELNAMIDSTKMIPFEELYVLWIISERDENPTKKIIEICLGNDNVNINEYIAKVIDEFKLLLAAKNGNTDLLLVFKDLYLTSPVFNEQTKLKIFDYIILNIVKREFLLKKLIKFYIEKISSINFKEMWKTKIEFEEFEKYKSLSGKIILNENNKYDYKQATKHFLPLYFGFKNCESVLSEIYFNSGEFEKKNAILRLKSIKLMLGPIGKFVRRKNSSEKDLIVKDADFFSRNLAFNSNLRHDFFKYKIIGDEFRGFELRDGIKIGDKKQKNKLDKFIESTLCLEIINKKNAERLHKLLIDQTLEEYKTIVDDAHKWVLKNLDLEINDER